jgi:GNAT superfamily N-acetyltransferase
VALALSSDLTLNDGTQIHIRPIHPEDEPRLIDIFNHLSPQSVYQRFFMAASELSPGMARHLATVDYNRRMALIAEVASEPVAVGRWEPSEDPDTVELALVVRDDWQNRGIGRVLLRETLRVAETHGIRRFRADVIADNRRMLRLLATEAKILERRTEAAVTTLILTQHSNS